jgi:hypothetical protein
MTGVEPGDLVFYFGSEWTVHTVTGKVAVLRQHDDPEATGSTINVALDQIQVFRKAADR